MPQGEVIEVTNYEAYESGQTVTTALSHELLNTYNAVETCYKGLDDSVFTGPAATTSREGIEKFTKTINDIIIPTYKDIISLLGDLKDNNIDHDDKVFDTVSAEFENRAARSQILSAYATLGKEGNVQAGLYGKSTQDKIYNFLRQKGYNNAGICGILANIEGESRFNYNAVGDSGTSYGLCQWHKTRWYALQNFCNRNNLDWRSLEGQLEYLVYELNTNYSWVNSYIKSVPDTAEGAYQAAYKWTTDFEVCDNSGYWGSVRGQNASTSYWSKYSS